jgi:3-dehydroquinate synthase II
MKNVWVNVDPWKKELVTSALEAGANAVIVPSDKVKPAKELGLITTVSGDGDLKWEKDVVRVRITSKADEDKIVELSHQKKVIVETKDWKIIPLENLVARAKNIFVEVVTREDAEMAAGVLERGVDGIVINERDPGKVREIIKRIKINNESIELALFKIHNVTPLGMGDRVCVDTCTIMKPGEGLLIGNSNQGMFLVHAESIENPYVSPRPFRVNAGPVHAYIMTPGKKTRYLSELGSGDVVMGVDAKGRTMSLLVGRVKIERRPLILIKAIAPNGTVSIILQNAETIRLVGPEGEAISVVKLKPGDQVLGHTEDWGRHFGHKIRETITEK